MSNKAEYTTVLDKNSIITARDGTELACDVYRPAVPGRFPAILTMLPYRKDDVAANACHQDYFVPRGYAVVNLDMRGTGSSAGFTASGAFCAPVDQLDGCDAIEWIARQPWCDGNVGMTGVSFGWFTALMTATRQPPHLRAIAPIYGGVDFYDDWNEGGSMLGHLFNGRYSAQMLAYNAAPPSCRDGDGRWLEVWREHLERNEPWLFSWLSNQTETGFWKECSLKYHYDKIKVPTFAIGGWNDFNPSDPFRVFLGVKAPVRVLVGPWTHGEPTDAIPGPRIDHRYELLRWWDHWLKGNQNGIMDEPRITLFVQQGAMHADQLDREGYWRFEERWPPRDGRQTRLFFGTDGRLSSRRPRIATGSDSFDHRPTIGTAAGLVGGVASGIGLPLDQRPDAALSLAYTSAPVKADTEVTGVPTVRLYVSSTADVAVFVVKLCDLAPDGATALITRGSLNGAHRVSHQKPRPLIPEQVYELDVALKATSYVVRKGHRIQVLVASADFPWLWPTAQTAVNTVHRNSSCPSAITFTVVPPRLGDQPRPRLKTSPRKSPPRPKATHYRIVHDRMAGTTTTSWGTHNEGKLAEGGGYAFDLRVIMTGSDRSPEDVVVEGEAAFTTRQAESTVQVNSHSKVRSDAGSFHAELSIEVIDNGAPYWQRTWSRAFPRRLM